MCGLFTGRVKNVHCGEVAVVCSAGVFWTSECTFSFLEDWGQEIFPEGVSVRLKKNGPGGGGGKGMLFSPHPTSPLHQSSTGQASKMALQAKVAVKAVVNGGLTVV